MAETSPKSVLVIGATGGSGQAMLRALQASHPGARAHAFVRTPSKLPSAIADGCASVITGDARDARAVQAALEETGATDAVLCTGDPNPQAVTDVRTATGRALADAVAARLAASGARTRVALLSSVGAGDSRIRLGWGVGTLMTAYLRRVVKDHSAQEDVLQKAFQARPQDLLIVRPTGLKDGEAPAGVVVHGRDDFVKPSVNRDDVAQWMIGQICGEGESFGKAIVLCSK